MLGGPGRPVPAGGVVCGSQVDSMTYNLAMEPRREGYLVLADISGYTAFLTGTELEHAQSIIEELTACIRKCLVPPLRFVKLEGDAVFCYGDTTSIKDGERLVEMLEVCYFEFSNLLFNMARSTTCRCAACAAIDGLGLKFIAHYGTYLVQRTGASEDLAGPDVILLHRLLKNTITAATGVGAYVFFTDACIERMPSGLQLERHTETYETLGEAAGGVYDLAPALEQMRDAHREYVDAADADHVTVIQVDQPPPIVWQYVVDPTQRLRWACVLFNKDPDETTLNPSGRSGTGTKSHCNHGPAEAYREIVDWRPFDYFTSRGTTRLRGGLLPARPIMETWELTSGPNGGTELSWRLRFIDRRLLSRLMLRTMALLFRGGVGSGARKLHAAIADDLARSQN